MKKKENQKLTTGATKKCKSYSTGYKKEGANCEIGKGLRRNNLQLMSIKEKDAEESEMTIKVFWQKKLGLETIKEIIIEGRHMIE